MNNSLRPRPFKLTRTALRTWATLFLALGIAGKSIIQNTLLGVGDLTGAEMLKLMEGSSTVMIMVTVALILQAIYACATPIFAFLLVEGFQKTSDLKMYVLRVLGLAIASEIPYDLAMRGNFFVWDSQNPVFGVAICLIMLYLYRRFEEKTMQNTLIKIAATVASFLWMGMLKINEGHCLFLLVAVLWLLRKKPGFRTLMGCTAAFVCTLFSPFYLVAPMAFLPIHFYDGESGEENRIINYLSYPVLLLASIAVGIMLK